MLRGQIYQPSNLVSGGRQQFWYLTFKQNPRNILSLPISRTVHRCAPMYSGEELCAQDATRK